MTKQTTIVVTDSLRIKRMDTLSGEVTDKIVLNPFWKGV